MGALFFDFIFDLIKDSLTDEATDAINNLIGGGEGGGAITQLEINDLTTLQSDVTNLIEMVAGIPAETDFIAAAKNMNNSFNSILTDIGANPSSNLPNITICQNLLDFVNAESPTSFYNLTQTLYSSCFGWEIVDYLTYPGSKLTNVPTPWTQKYGTSTQDYGYIPAYNGLSNTPLPITSFYAPAVSTAAALASTVSTAETIAQSVINYLIQLFGYLITTKSTQFTIPSTYTYVATPETYSDIYVNFTLLLQNPMNQAFLEFTCQNAQSTTELVAVTYNPAPTNAAPSFGIAYQLQQYLNAYPLVSGGTTIGDLYSQAQGLSNPVTNCTNILTVPVFLVAQEATTFTMSSLAEGVWGFATMSGTFVGISTMSYSEPEFFTLVFTQIKTSQISISGPMGGYMTTNNGIGALKNEGSGEWLELPVVVVAPTATSITWNLYYDSTTSTLFHVFSNGSLYLSAPGPGFGPLQWQETPMTLWSFVMIS